MESFEMNTIALPFTADAILFDCDSTLSTIEGIDELAAMNHVTDAVKALTRTAMGETGLTTALYAERLALTQPTAQQVDEIGQCYITHLTADLLETLQRLTALNKTIYIVSAGIEQAVKILATYLNIPLNRVYAVPVFFDAAGKFYDFDRSNPLARSDGKRDIVQQLKKIHQHIVLIGDGKNDLACQGLVDRFIGFGGNYRHAAVEAAATFYVRSPSMLAVLPYCLSEMEFALQTPLK